MKSGGEKKIERETRKNFREERERGERQRDKRILLSKQYIFGFVATATL